MTNHSTALNQEARMPETKAEFSSLLEGLSWDLTNIRQLVDSLPEGIAIADSSGRLIEWNAGMTRILGLTREQALHQSYDEIARCFAAPNQPLPIHIFPSLVGESSTWDGLVVNARIQHPDGGERLMQHQVFTIPTPGETLTGIVARDITDDTTTEKTLRATNEDLEQRVAERTAALSEALLALRQEVAVRRQVEESLRYRLEVEKIVSRIANRFLSGSPETLDHQVRIALQTIGEFIGADLGHLLLFNLEPIPTARVYEWAKTESDKILADAEYVSLEPFAWSCERLETNDPSPYLTLDCFPPEAAAEKELLSRLGVRSYIAVGVSANNHLLGTLCFGTRHQVKTWADEDVLMLRMVAEILGNVLHHQHAEIVLQAIQIRQAAMLSLLPAVVYICDLTPTGRVVTWVSSNIERVTGFTANQFRAGTGLWRARIHPDDQARVTEIISHASGGPISVEYRWRSADGSYRWILDQAITKSANEPNQLVGVWLDITARHESEQAEHEQRILAEALRDTAELLNNTLDTTQVIQGLLASVERVVPCDGCNIMILDDDVWRVVAARGYEVMGDSNLIGATFDLEKLVGLQRNVMNGQPNFVAHTKQAADWVDIPETRWIRSYIGMPLRVQGETISCLSVDSATPNYFNETHVARLKALTAQASVAMANALLYAETQHKASRLRALSQRLVEAQEIERARIARELHDELGQILTALMVDLHYLERHIQQPDLLVRVADAKKTVNNGLEDLRQMVIDLRPTMLGKLGLVHALQQYVELFQKQFEIPAELETVGLESACFSDETEVALYRIVQEALTNIARHAHAHRAEVLFSLMGDSLRVTIWDDGVGFDPNSPIPGNHTGLVGIRERAEMLGGSLVLTSRPNEGTTVLIEIPYVNPNSDH